MSNSRVNEGKYAMNAKKRLKMRKIAVDLWRMVVSEGDRPNRRLSSDDPVSFREGCEFPLSLHLNVCILSQTLCVGIVTLRVERDWDEDNRFHYISEFHGRESNILRMSQFLKENDPTTEAVDEIMRVFRDEFIPHQRYQDSYKRIKALPEIQRSVTLRHTHFRDRSQPNHEGREEIILQHDRRPGRANFLGGVLCTPDYYMTEAARHDLAPPNSRRLGPEVS